LQLCHLFLHSFGKTLKLWQDLASGHQEAMDALDSWTSSPWTFAWTRWQEQAGCSPSGTWVSTSMQIHELQCSKSTWDRCKACLKHYMAMEVAIWSLHCLWKPLAGLPLFAWSASWQPPHTAALHSIAYAALSPSLDSSWRRIHCSLAWELKTAAAMERPLEALSTL
jgi:hypothetical protein